MITWLVRWLGNRDPARSARRGRARARLCLAGLWLILAAQLARSEEGLSVLTNAQDVLTLGIAGAIRAPHPVRLRGVVTYPVIRRPWFYLHDGSAGILVCCSNEFRLPSAGEFVAVRGVAGPGLQAPHVLSADYTVLGTAPYPPPHPVTPARLAAGEEFGQWVTLTGNVLDYFLYPGQLSLLLQEGVHHFVVNISLAGDMAPPNRWIGGRVEVNGVNWNEARPSGVVSGFRLSCPGTNQVTLLRPGPAELFDWPLRPIQSLRRTADPAGGRVKVAGVITALSQGSDPVLFLHDDTGDAQVRLLKPITEQPYLRSVNGETLFKTMPSGTTAFSYGRPRPHARLVDHGDFVEVIGTQVPSELGVVLADAEYRRTGAGKEPEPARAGGSDLRAGRRENQLVSFEGRLVDRQTRPGTYGVVDLLMLQQGSTPVQVLFTSEPSRAIPVFPRGASLRVTGVCATEIGEWKEIRTLRLLPRDPQDVILIAQPSLWDSWRVVRVLAITSGLALATLPWIGFLRVRVAQRTAELARSNTRLKAEVEERKRTQAELSRALANEKELNQLKSRFVSLVSHEFRTPLGVILASADLLSDYLETLSPEERAEQLADIKHSTRHMAMLMEDVLVLGRVESGRMGYRPRDFDLAEFCRRLVDELLSATTRRCPIEFEAAGLAESARGDEILLRHILNNLLANGVKYSQPGQPVRFAARRDGEDAVFTVEDEGMGIPETDQRHVFEAFYRGGNTADRPGSGLGLVVVKRCVDIHGGTVSIASAEGRGTTVTVRVPLFRAAGQTEMIDRPGAGHPDTLL